MMDLLTRINQHYQELTEQERQMITALQKVDLTWGSLTSNELAKKIICFTGKYFPNVKEVGGNNC